MKVLAFLLIVGLLNNPVIENLQTSHYGDFNSANSINAQNINVEKTTHSISKDEQQEMLVDMYENIPQSELEMFRKMSVIEIKEKLDSFQNRYEVGEPFTEKDQALLLYAYNEYGGGNLYSNNNAENKYRVPLEPIANSWNSYSVGSSKEKLGVKTTYKGTLKTYVNRTGGRYATDVKVTVNSGKRKIKSLKWKTYHSAYGVIGMSGKTPSLGIVYDGSISSSSYTNTFSFEKTKNDTAVLPAYIKTWGKVFVRTTSGEYNYGTKVYSSWE